MAEESDPSKSDINIQGTGGDLTIGGDVVGRDKISVGSITIEQFVAGGISLQSQLDFFAKSIGLASQEARYMASQYEAYCNIWKNLQSLRLAGDELWERATAEGVATLSKRLGETQLMVRESEIFFEEEDRQQLLSLLDTLARYRLGKLRLVEMRSTQDLGRFGVSPRMIQEVREQISINGGFRERYEHLLERIRISFKQRLSTKSS